MSNYAPIHAIGAKQHRNIEARLHRHAELMAKFEAEGLGRNEASSQAMRHLEQEWLEARKKNRLNRY